MPDPIANTDQGGIDVATGQPTEGSSSDPYRKKDLRGRTRRSFKFGLRMSDDERDEAMNDLIAQFQRASGLDNVKRRGKIEDKIRGLAMSYQDESLGIDELINSLHVDRNQNPDNYYSADTYPWADNAQDPLPGTADYLDVDTSSSTNDLANVPGYEDFLSTLPPNLQIEGMGWKEMAQADLTSQWIEAQRRNAGQDRAANVAAQQLDAAQQLGDTPVMSDDDVQRMLGQQAGQLAGLEGRQMSAIRDNMGSRGIAPGSGIGAGLAGQASLQRQMGLTQAGSQLQNQQMALNRSGLERAMGMESSAASNLSNVLTGYGTQQFNLPAADYWRTLNDPEWAMPGGGSGQNVSTNFNVGGGYNSGGGSQYGLGGSGSYRQGTQ